ncbi:MAG: hypothetical protein HOY78_02620 [Saccharothrix sp.]|nr:hypothetical protein [Saccharothrix sp.]
MTRKPKPKIQTSNGVRALDALSRAVGDQPMPERPGSLPQSVVEPIMRRYARPGKHGAARCPKAGGKVMFDTRQEAAEADLELDKHQPRDRRVYSCEDHFHLFTPK